MSRDTSHPDPVVQAIAAAMAEKRRELIAQPLSRIWAHLAEEALRIAKEKADGPQDRP